MDQQRTIKGFSKLSKRGKIKWLVENFFKDPEAVMKELKSYWLQNEADQKLFDGFSENTISNFPLPYGIAPNFVINGKTYAVPMVTEESSVVAAAANAAKFWMHRGGFHVEIVDTIKTGQVHFYWSGPQELLFQAFDEFKADQIQLATPLTRNMENRGGGILDIELNSFDHLEKDYYQINVKFDTCDSMGANFINSVLELFATNLSSWITTLYPTTGEVYPCEVIMSILSNYTPQCLAVAHVECSIEELGQFAEGMTPQKFAERFQKALKIAEINPYRATTHNKGIFNGIDAVVLATGNDFRAIEACGHTHASRSGTYASLSFCNIENGQFRFSLEIPLAVGTVGGLTNLHPIAKRSLELLGNPDAKELMAIIASVGLAQNFSAVKSLITTGIQQGHMKLHLQNILVSCGATDEEALAAKTHFANRVVSYSAVRDFLYRNSKNMNKIS